MLSWISSVSLFFRAYSSRYIAAKTPMGKDKSAVSPTTQTVPKSAGSIPA